MTTEAHTHQGHIAAAVRLHTRHALAAVGLRLARALGQPFDGQQPAGMQSTEPDVLQPALAFTAAYARELGPCTQTPPQGHALLRLRALTPDPAQADLLLDLLLLACLPEAHEGYGALCRLFHPAGEARPTVALALHWLESEAVQGPQSAPFELRDLVETLLNTPNELGWLDLQGSGPWHSRSLHPGPGVWEALMGRPPQLRHAELLSGYAEVPGLQSWLASPPCAQAVAVLRRGLPCQLLLLGGDAAMRRTRVLALLGAAHTAALRTGVDALDTDTRQRQCAAAHTAALLHQACLWLESRQDADSPEAGFEPPRLPWALTVISSAHSERGAPSLGLPIVRLPVEPLAATARRSLWQALLPQWADQAGVLAARYPIDPDDAREVVRDLSLRQALSAGSLGLDAVADCIRARTPWTAHAGVQRVQARADWAALLLPGSAQAQLRSAVQRVLQQITVLDDWGYAQGRSQRRGVRLLFFGPPGTGKSLAAEVMARALGVDMLVVDLASLVSKWIGETEKNLAAVFELAERSRALLLFDEADALFAKRTESNDAHDRHANLQTAYLLQRLERYQGVAVLTTNLRANLDSAFARRFEYIVPFPEPDAQARLALWQLHLPAAAPLAADVDLAELAAWYALSGAQIQNAALAAAFGAAAAGQALHQQHFLQAIEREYDKAGRAHPGHPPPRRERSAAVDVSTLTR